MAALWNKATFFLRVGTYGFSESWYLPGGNISTTLLNLMQQYANKRVAMMPPNTFIDYGRLASIYRPTQRISVVFTGNQLGGGSLQGTYTLAGAEGASAAYERILVKCYDATQAYSKNWFCGAIPDLEVEAGGALFIDSAWRAAFNSFMDFLGKAQFGWLAQVRPNPLTANIGTISIGLLGTCAIQTSIDIRPSGVGFNQDFQVRISGVYPRGQLNGLVTVYATDTTHVTTRDAYFISSNSAGGRITANNQQLIALAGNYQNNSLIFRASSRRAGRPGYQSRGRQRTRLIRV